MKRAEALGGDVVLEDRGTYLHIYHRRSARDLEEAQQVLDAMDRAIGEWGHQDLLFDSRDSDLSSREVGDRVWAWLSQHSSLHRVATLVKSELLAQSINMGGISKRVRIRGFHEEAAAIEWLTTGKRSS